MSKVKKAAEIALEWLPWIVVPVLVVGILFNGSIFSIARVDGDSMYPTYKDGQRLLVNCIGKNGATYGDVVVISRDAEGKTPLIKRIIALAGDTIEFIDGRVILNGDALDESAYYTGETFGKDIEGAFTVPPETVFVMGDNREVSFDSRKNGIGPRSVNDIVGIVVSSNIR